MLRGGLAVASAVVMSWLYIGAARAGEPVDADRLSSLGCVGPTVDSLDLAAMQRSAVSFSWDRKSTRTLPCITCRSNPFLE
jgi:hypothetical protein